VLALDTADTRLELAVKQVNNDGLVTQEVVVPCLHNRQADKVISDAAASLPAMKQVNNDGLVMQHMVVPCLVARQTTDNVHCHLNSCATKIGIHSTRYRQISFRRH